MRIEKPYELLHKEVYDKNGHSIGVIDKVWNSWNELNPGPFFGVKINQAIKNKYFRGTDKLVSIYGYNISKVEDCIVLNKSIDELYCYWNKIIRCGHTACTTDELLEKPVYDKNHSRIGTFFSSVESYGPSKHYGIYLDPYLSKMWKKPHNTLMPVPTNYILYVNDTITLDKTIEELKKYWKEQFDY